MSTREMRVPLRVYHAALTIPLGEAHIFGTAVGLLAIALPTETANTTIATLTHRLGALDLVTGPPLGAGTETRQAALAREFGARP